MRIVITAGSSPHSVPAAPGEGDVICDRPGEGGRLPGGGWTRGSEEGGEEHPHHFSFQISLNGGVRGDFGLYLLAVSCGESAAKTVLLFVAFCGVLRHIPRRFLR